MKTKQIRARRLTTNDRLVVQGKLRRETLPIAEIGKSGQRVEVVARNRSAFERHSFNTNDYVRVMA